MIEETDSKTTTDQPQRLAPAPCSASRLPGSEHRMYGDSPLDWANQMAACVAERALTKDWEAHPMFGIAVSTDKWAVAYQNALSKLKAMLDEPNDKDQAQPDNQNQPSKT